MHVSAPMHVSVYIYFCAICILDLLFVCFLDFFCTFFTFMFSFRIDVIFFSLCEPSIFFHTQAPRRIYNIFRGIQYIKSYRMFYLLQIHA